MSASARFCFLKVLLVRYPNLLSANFVESVFVLNNYALHASYNKFPESTRESELFSLAGKELFRFEFRGLPLRAPFSLVSSSARKRVYTAMLEEMSDEQKFQLTAKLCQDVLGAFVDGVVPLPDNECPGPLADTLWILSCEVRVGIANER